MHPSAGNPATNSQEPVSPRTAPLPRAVSRFLARHFKRRTLRLPFFVLGHAARHLQLVRLMHAAGLRATPMSPSAASYRYLRKCYLGGSFPLDACLSIATGHHRHLMRVFSAAVLARMRGPGHALWEKSSGGHLLDIILRFPYHYNFDGDLCLTMGLDGKDIYILTFSICNGGLVDGSDDQVLLIASIQGQRGKIKEIRQATAACQDVAPPQLLLAAAEALAQLVGVQKIAGAGGGGSGADDAAPASGGTGRAELDYDTFWRSLTGASASQRWYVMALPFRDKPMASVVARHRGRARARRAVRDQLRAEILQQARTRLT